MRQGRGSSDSRRAASPGPSDLEDSSSAPKRHDLRGVEYRPHGLHRARTSSVHHASTARPPRRSPAVPAADNAGRRWRRSSSCAVVAERPSGQQAGGDVAIVDVLREDPAGPRDRVPGSAAARRVGALAAATAACSARYWRRRLRPPSEAAAGRVRSMPRPAQQRVGMSAGTRIVVGAGNSGSLRGDLGGAWQCARAAGGCRRSRIGVHAAAVEAWPDELRGRVLQLQRSVRHLQTRRRNTSTTPLRISQAPPILADGAARRYRSRAGDEPIGIVRPRASRACRLASGASAVRRNDLHTVARYFWARIE